MFIWLLGTVIFIQILLIIELILYAVRMFRYPDRAEVHKRLKNGLVTATDGEHTDITKNKVFSDIPFLNQFIIAFPGVERLDLLMRQAKVKYTMGFFLLLSMTLGFTGYLVAFILIENPLISLLPALPAVTIPYLFLRMKKNKRTNRFEKQLPEGLDLIARALRAGHAFTNGMKLAAEEFPDPLGPEFDETLDEINFGINVSDALKHLAQRVDCPDLGFFVVAVILQRETGGNLAEIIENLAHLMRERFKFRGKIRILSAEGRLTGKILVAIPVVLFAVIYFLNKDYASILIHDPAGRMTVGISVFLIVAGLFWMKRVLKLDV
jgi:tight adherence protein B